MMAFAAQLVPSTFLRVLSSTSFETFATERDPTNLLVACGLAKLVCFPVREKDNVALVVVGKVLSRDCLKTCDASVIFRTDKVRTHRNKAIQRVISGILAKQDRTNKFKTTVRYYFSSIDMKPVQENDDDCGVLALYFMREVAQNLMENPDFDLMKHLSNTCQQPKLNATMVRMRFKGLLVSDESMQSKRR
jgi:hypothetical protein